MDERPPSWNGVPVPYGAGVEELARQIRGPAPTRWAAFVALAHTGGEAAVALLRECAGSADGDVRRIAVEAIGVHADGHVLGSVVQALLRDRSPAVVRSACGAAARQRLAAAHDSIADLLDDADPLTRAAALGALRDLWRDADFDGVLQAFTSDASADVRKEAAWTLRSVASASTWHRLFAVWQADPVPRHRAWACELAGEHGDAHALGDLRGLVADPNGHVRDAAADAIRAIEARRIHAE